MGHPTKTERHRIEQLLRQQKNFQEIAMALNRPRSTIMRNRKSYERIRQTAEKTVCRLNIEGIFLQIPEHWRVTGKTK